MTIIDVMGDMAAARAGLGISGTEIPVVIQMANGERYEVKAHGFSMGGNTSFINSKGKADCRPCMVLTFEQFPISSP